MEKYDYLNGIKSIYKKYLDSVNNGWNSEFFRFDGRYLVEGINSGLGVLERNILSSKDKGNLLYTVNMVANAMPINRSHKRSQDSSLDSTKDTTCVNDSEHDLNAYLKLFLNLYRRAYFKTDMNHIDDSTLIDAFKCSLRTYLKSGSEMVIKPQILNFLTLLKRIAGNKNELLKWVNAFIAEPAKFYSDLSTINKDNKNIDAIELQKIALQIYKSQTINLNVNAIDIVCAAEFDADSNDCVIEDNKIYYDFTSQLKRITDDG